MKRFRSSTLLAAIVLFGWTTSAIAQQRPIRLPSVSPPLGTDASQPFEQIRWPEQVQLPEQTPWPEPSEPGGDEADWPVQLTSHLDTRGNVASPATDWFENYQPVDRDSPPDTRDGVFQKLIFESSWIPETGSKPLGMTDLELKAVFALPIPSRRCPLLIIPGYATHFLDGPATPDMPPRVHDAYVQFRSMGRITSELSLDLAITTGVYSDFRGSAEDAFRITGHAAAQYALSDQWKIVGGASYINTYDVDVIPIGGLIWQPNETVKIEALFPYPRAAMRTYALGARGRQTQDWLYVAGDFANDTWDIVRADTSDDEVNYRDWRILFGWERKVFGGLDANLEVGYVFNRKLHYESATADYRPTSSPIIRGSLTY